MNEQASNSALPSGIAETDMHAVCDRTKELIALVKGDSNGVALDSLFSAYVNEAYRRDKRPGCAALMLRVGRMMAEDTMPLGASPGVNAVAAPGAAAPAGYTAEDVAAINRLLDSLARRLHDVPGQIALSALLTMYMRVAQVQGDELKAAENLLATGARVVMQQTLAGNGAQGMAPAGTTLH
jgi:hypothetical protein